MSALRDRSIATYTKLCPVDDKPHDWRYASHAPGYLIGDACACCQKCHLRGINPAPIADEVRKP